MTYSDMLINVGKQQAALCNNNSITYINCLVKFGTMRQLMTSVYFTLVHTNQVSKIENLPLEEKTALWAQTKEFAANTLSLSEMIKLSRCLYALEYLLI